MAFLIEVAHIGVDKEQTLTFFFKEKIRGEKNLASVLQMYLSLS